MGIKDMIGEKGEELAEKAKAMAKQKGEEIVAEAKQKFAEEVEQVKKVSDKLGGMLKK